MPASGEVKLVQVGGDAWVGSPPTSISFEHAVMLCCAKYVVVFELQIHKE